MPTGPSGTRNRAPERAGGFLRRRKPIFLTFPGPGNVLPPTDSSVKPLAVLKDGAMAVSFRGYGRGALNIESSTDGKTWL